MLVTLTQLLSALAPVVSALARQPAAWITGGILAVFFIIKRSR